MDIKIICSRCKIQFDKNTASKKSLTRKRCRHCIIQDKRDYRAKKAIKEGRAVDLRHLHDGHCRTYKKFITDKPRFIHSFVHRGLANGLWTLKSWKEMSDSEYLQYYYSNFSKTIGMTDAEIYRYRYNNDSAFRLKELLRRQQNKAIKRDGIAETIRFAIKRNGNSNRVEQLLGYTICELMKSIESKFTEGMSWEVFKSGAIHIDHLIPQAAFNLNDDEQWRKCWSIENLQPLWAADNLKKSDRLSCGALGREKKYESIFNIDSLGPFAEPLLAEANASQEFISG